MIKETLTFLEDTVNDYFDVRLGPSTEDRLVIDNIAKLADNDINGESSRAILSLVNLEEDRIAKNPLNHVRTDDGISYRNPPMLFNLYALFAITTSTYTTALETLALVIQCFQGRCTFDRADHPKLPRGLEQLHLELITLNFEQINHLWSTLGGKYYPSVLYKVKVVSILDEDAMLGGELIREIQTNHVTINPS